MGWRKTLCIFLLLLPWLVIPINAHAIIQITRSTFCLGISDREAVNPLTDSVALRSEKLFFWMEFIGSKAALDYLEQGGQLRIAHEWRKGILLVDSIEVGITQERWLAEREKIRAEFRQKGFFTWRTFSFKENLNCATYNIVVVDHDGNGVVIISNPNKIHRPSIKLIGPKEE